MAFDNGARPRYLWCISPGGAPNVSKTHPAGPGAMQEAVQDLKREWIMRQALTHFSQHGYAQTTLDDIAGALGKTKPFIYSYFTNKSELLAQVATAGLKASLAVARAARDRPGPPRARLDWLVREFTRAVIEHEPNIAIYFREEKHIDPETAHQISKMRKEFDQIVVAILREGVETGEFDVPDPHATALAIGGMISWIYTWHKPGRRFSKAALAEVMANLVLRMVDSR